MKSSPILFAVVCLALLCNCTKAFATLSFASTPTKLETLVGDEFDVALVDLLDDTGSGKLTWKAADLPAWLSFDCTSGRLTGVPFDSDAGTDQFELSVSDGVTTISNHPVILGIFPR